MVMLALDARHNPIYQGLSEVREIFHRDGRLNDSNQKLDETLKLLAIHFAGGRSEIDRAKYKLCLSKDTFSLATLRKLFSELIEKKIFETSEGTSLFENSSSLSFADDEERLVYELFSTLAFSGVGDLAKNNSIDFLNEAFCYFIRDNFRNNIEDAQYMTPPEVVEFIVSIANDLLATKSSGELVVMDPSCGVGSFLREFFIHWNDTDRSVKYVAQDKVERMARLTAANFIFSSTENFEIHIGNSLYKGSPIDQWNGKIDLILTNPPFGAKFDRDEIFKRCGDNTPSYQSAKSLPATVDSELIFIDRYVRLLKDGGICLAIVPDGVISAKGPAAFARACLLSRAEVLAVIELPSVTFAQAGTRTKTSVLVFRKTRKRVSQSTFFSDVEEIGFEVTKRKGVAVKRIVGKNELLDVVAAWQRRDLRDEAVASRAAWVKTDLASLDAWTPRSILFQNRIHSATPTDLVPLRGLVQPLKRRKARWYSEGTYFISVLHVIGEGLLDLNSLYGYKPITAGKPVSSGEVLVSRINPRIPRVLVVPPLPGDIICSSEFEVLTPLDDVDAFHLAYALSTPFAQEQLQSLTTGTSASHARIKPGKVLDIMLPWPNNAKHRREMARHKINLQHIFENMFEIMERRTKLDIALSR